MAWQQQGSLQGPAGTTPALSIGTVTTGAAGAAAQVTNSGTVSAPVFNFVIPQGAKGDAGAGVAIAGSVATYAALPTGLTAADSGKGYLVDADGLLYIWSGTAFPANGSGVEFRGPAGTAATVTVGSVTGAAAGTSPVVTNSGTSSAAILNFTLPAGATGTAGAAASVSIGTVATGSPGSAATVNNGGTGSAAVLNFSIPAGQNGNNGTQWFNGTGAPGTVTGANVGDYYLDSASGTYYKLS